MKKKLLLTVAVVVALLTVSFVAQQATVKKYKCLIQLTNYKGGGLNKVAYFIIPQEKMKKPWKEWVDNPDGLKYLPKW